MRSDTESGDDWDWRKGQQGTKEKQGSGERGVCVTTQFGQQA